MTTFNETITLTKIDCGECGGTYAINEARRQKCAQDGSSWTCPYCRVYWGYSNNNENARLKQQLEQKERELRSAKCDIINERLAKEQADRKLKRVNRGVCPCCNRSFQNLARHMSTKHPEKKP